jgi:hypothetical protein
MRPTYKEEKLMINDKPLGRTLLLVLALSAFIATSGTTGEVQPGPQAAPPATSPIQEAPPAVQLTLEPKAIDLLQAASSRLAAARSLRFTAVVTYESPSRLVTPLAYTTKSEVTLQRPDKLRVITSGDGPASEFYYNGKTMVAFAPAENLVAVAEAPPTLDAALKAAYDAAAIYFPFTDVIVADPYKAIAEGLLLAFYIGPSSIVGGTTTDMVAYANTEVFVRMWIGTADKLPRLLRAVYRADQARLRHQLELANWQLDLAVPKDAFAATSAGSATPMPFAHPHPPRPQGDKAPATGQPAKRN